MASSKHWGAGVLACSNTGVLVAALMAIFGVSKLVWLYLEFRETSWLFLEFTHETFLGQVRLVRPNCHLRDITLGSTSLSI